MHAQPYLVSIYADLVTRRILSVCGCPLPTSMGLGSFWEDTELATGICPSCFQREVAFPPGGIQPGDHPKAEAAQTKRALLWELWLGAMETWTPLHHQWVLLSCRVLLQHSIQQLHSFGWVRTYIPWHLAARTGQTVLRSPSQKAQGEVGRLHKNPCLARVKFLESVGRYRARAGTAAAAPAPWTRA